ncbi:MAG: translation elongation factor 4 [Minisyncoccales bacterium]
MEKIRNFVIISHIDHGKSTLADRFLELTKTIKGNKVKSQHLDMMDLEKEKGITIKMQPARMKYKGYILNLIDTPGHVDFSYEVSRSLAAVEGAVLLVDATKGIQAQTLANLKAAQEQNLTILPVVNKIDLEHAKVEETKKEITNLLNINKSEISAISAKEGTNVEKLLNRIIKEIPAPKKKSPSVNKQRGDGSRGLIFDSKYNSYKGVLAYIRVTDGSFKKSDKIVTAAEKKESEAKELGFFSPQMVETKEIKEGEIGYIATGIKEPGKVKVGDTVFKKGDKIKPLSGYKEPKPVVFAGIYPKDVDQFANLKKALSELRLNDSSFTYEATSKEGLGRGFTCGFLGSLHAEIVSERLKREFGLDLVITSPTVVFKTLLSTEEEKQKEKEVYSATDWPDRNKINKIKEPWVNLEIVAPSEYYGAITEVLEEIEGNYSGVEYLSSERVLINYETPLKDIVVNFYDYLKGATEGFASMNYEVIGYREADLVKMDILVAGEKKEAFSQIVQKGTAYKKGRKILKRLKKHLPPQLFEVPLQAKVEGNIIARETIKAKRKDVTAPLYGGDVTRKKKLLENQKERKKEMRKEGRVDIPNKVFLKMFGE